MAGNMVWQAAGMGMECSGYVGASIMGMAARYGYGTAAGMGMPFGVWVWQVLGMGMAASVDLLEGIGMGMGMQPRYAAAWYGRQQGVVVLTELQPPLPRRRS